MAKTLIVNGIHNYTAPEEYIPPKSEAVKRHLEWFMDQKLGLMMHWAPGCQLGTYESWPLSDGDGSWSQEDMTWDDIEVCKQQYWDANLTFNPIKFSPENWARMAAECGFKYLLFTTKHHDGFCMYDTKTTDYKITADNCPFHTHKNADIAGALFREFRRQGLGISVYFSKPDWHSEYYWAPQFGPAADRNVNYDISENPELWEKYVQFTHSQIRELCTKYGKVDVLWLDGGWVRPDNLGQDIRLGEIVNKLRSGPQPHLIVCDRTVGGEFENIVTPEKEIPERPMNIPWETCTTVGDRFSFHYTDNFKTGRQLVHLLLNVVSRGGNLALNVAPQPDGALPAGAVASLRDLGRWMRIHGEGIYNTTIAEPYFIRNIRYTAKGDTRYIFYLYEDCAALPLKLHLQFSGKAHKIRLMRTGQEVPFEEKGGELLLDTSAIDRNTAFYADCFVVN